ncbi:IclR family transcriptional regulator [Campylobacter geochelonis]|uniref:IclR family transcriptional regulator n=1 Tax=Campylobacter geochelonis TaxID=1780362 RepID=UPI000770717D|nr:IclR family transcriptional regulator [Campylobacter geochelonis]CZE50093.1 IclR family transcriptional regulator [Campylobacter geochelonis]
MHNPTLRVLEVFNALYESDAGLSLTEIAHITKIPKGTLHPIIATLLQTQHLQSIDNKLYIGKSAFQIGNAYLKNFNHLDLIKNMMNQIALECDEICQLGILDGAEVLYIAKVDTPQTIRLTSSVGRTLRAYATAIGRALLAYKSNDEIKELYKDGLVAYTQDTTKTIDELIQKLNIIRRTKISHEIAETNPDIECVAVALESGGVGFAAISVSIPLYRSNRKKLDLIKHLLLQKKSVIEDKMTAAGIRLVHF